MWLIGHVPPNQDWRGTSAEGAGWLWAKEDQVWILKHLHNYTEHLDNRILSLREGKVQKTKVLLKSSIMYIDELHKSRFWTAECKTEKTV